MSEILVVAGLSGAGRSGAANVLQDLGWFKVDNLPPSLFPSIIELARRPSGFDRVAIVMGSDPWWDGLPDAVRDLQASDQRVRVLFLEASTEALVTRYEATRRPHPLDDGSGRVVPAVERERELLVPLRELADLIVDTSDLNVHDLRRRVVSLFGSESDETMTVSIVSFGFKHGLPRDVDVVFDVRFLPNPHWVDELRPKTGLDADVADYVLEDPMAQDFLRNVERLLTPLLPAYEAEGKSYLSIGIGCTGGHHRSVAVSETLARRLEALGRQPVVTHRDIER